MPIKLPVQTHRVSQQEFGEIAYEVMRHIFAIQNEFGRFFDEKIYKRELAARMSGIVLEVPITVTHDSFWKEYYADVLVQGIGVFEVKAVEAIHPRHIRQTVNYLLLTDLEHAKVVNVRPEMVEHEFVNCSLRLNEQRNPIIREEDWDHVVPGATSFRDILIPHRRLGRGIGIAVV